MLDDKLMGALEEELRSTKAVYTKKKHDVLVQLSKFWGAKAPDVDAVQNTLDSMRRELHMFRDYKKALKKVIRLSAQLYSKKV